MRWSTLLQPFKVADAGYLLAGSGKQLCLTLLVGAEQVNLFLLMLVSQST